MNFKRTCRLVPICLFGMIGTQFIKISGIEILVDGLVDIQGTFIKTTRSICADCGMKSTPVDISGSHTAWGSCAVDKQWLREDDRINPQAANRPNDLTSDPPALFGDTDDTRVCLQKKPPNFPFR